MRKNAYRVKQNALGRFHCVVIIVFISSYMIIVWVSVYNFIVCNAMKKIMNQGLGLIV